MLRCDLNYVRGPDSVDHAIKWGVFPQPRGGRRGIRALEDIEALVGRKFVVQRNYLGMDSDILSRLVLALSDRGTVPYRSFHAWTGKRPHTPIQWRDVAAGSQDAWLEKQASDLVAWGKPIYLSFHHEPEDDVTGDPATAAPPGCGSPADFEAAWNHVRDVFDRFPNPSVTWVAALTATTFGGGNGGVGAWLPGTRFDMLGVDGYNRGTFSQRNGWRSFEQIFAPAFGEAQALGKSLFIGEVGCVEAGGNKAAWVADAMVTLKGWVPSVHAVCWSNVDTVWRGQSMGYRIDSSPGALAAYVAAGLDPVFGAGL